MSRKHPVLPIKKVLSLVLSGNVIIFFFFFFFFFLQQLLLTVTLKYKSHY